MPTVLIPTPLRRFTGNSSKVFIEGSNVAEIIDNLVTEYPDVQRHLLDAGGNVRSFINIFIDQHNMRSFEDQGISIASNSVVSLVPAIAGGNLEG